MREVPRLQFDAIAKSFGAMNVLHNISLSIGKGEVYGLLGENGAGKSTLLKILCGAIAPSSGHVFIDGQKLLVRRPIEARRAGIAMIHQELQQIARLTVAQNMFLGACLTYMGGLFVARRAQEKKAAEILATLDPSIDPSAPISSLKVAQRQIVEIASALLGKAKIIAMDEPTSSLTKSEFEKLKAVIAKLSHEGVSIIYVSHKMDEIFQLCHRSAILRDGKMMGVVEMDKISHEEIIALMVGRQLMQEKHRSFRQDTVRLQLHKICSRKIRDVSLHLHRGEVLGIAGLVGSGRTELLRLIAGVDKTSAGFLTIDGKKHVLASPRAAIAAGIGLVPEERKRDGLILNRPVTLNVALPALSRFRRAGLVQRQKLKEVATDWLKKVDLRPCLPERPVRFFSGGNQQKAIVARWLVYKSDILLFDEPTRGIDIGAKAEIYRLIERLAEEGRSIIVVSSELPEIIRLADRVMVMRDGAIAGTLEERADITENAIIALAMSGSMSGVMSGLHKEGEKTVS